jgi:hypothetical protein
LNDALDVVDADDRNVETSVAVAPRDRARHASARQFIERARRNRAQDRGALWNCRHKFYSQLEAESAALALADFLGAEYRE